MLEFLGLESEVVMLFLYAALLGIIIGICMGVPAGLKKDSSSASALTIIGMILGIVILFFSAKYLFLLFITFQWKWIFLPLLLCVALGAVFFFIFRAWAFAARLGKYKRTPVIKKAVKYCRENNIVAIQCHADMIRFYRELKNTEYCKDSTYSRYAISDTQCDEYLASDFRPDYWKAYDRFPIPGDDILFADMEYPPLEDIDIFAKALASRLGGCAIAKHQSYVEFKGFYINKKTGEGKRAHHFIYSQDDRFIYKKRALEELKKKEGKADPDPVVKKEKPKPEKKWE